MIKNRTSAATLPILGTSWQKRSGSYWTRRAVYSLLMAVAMLVETAILAGIWQSIGSPSGRLVFVWIEALLSAVVAAYVLIGIRRTAKRSGATPKPSSQAIKTGVALGLLARAGSILGSVFLVLGSLLTYGLVIVLFIRSFLPRLDIERRVNNNSAF